MTPFEDATLRYAMRLDGLATATARAMTADIKAALDHVMAELLRRNPDATPWTYARLMAMQTELQGLRQALADKLGEHVDAAVSGVLETSGPALQGAFKGMEAVAVQAGAAGLGVQWVSIPVDQMSHIGQQSFDGHSWQAWGRKLADDTLSRVESELRQGVALGEGIPKMARRIQAAGDLSRNSADALARTAVNDIANRARMALADKNRSIIKGYKFSAVLDGRVSPQCRALSGKEWTIDAPDIRRPPLHPRCRSQLIILTKTFAELLGPEYAHLDGLPEGTRPATEHTTSLKNVPKDERKIR